MIDIEENVYNTIKICDQEWMAENLRVTKYNDGSAIPLVPGNSEWSALFTPGYCYYNNTTNTDRIKKWGALYNWYVVDPANPQKIAPAGWHVPTDAEWDTLLNYLISKYDNPNLFCEASISGFSALPGGCRNNYGAFYNKNYHGYLWSNTKSSMSFAFLRFLDSLFGCLSRYSDYKSCGFSVRLIKD